MPKISNIQYNPALSIKENAKRNGVSEASIRYYIKTNLVDRRFDRKQNIIDECRKYLKKHPKATRNELQQKTGHSLSTIRKYWKYITTEEELTDFDNRKAQKRQLRQNNNFYATHPSVTRDILREEHFTHKILEPFCGGGTMAETIKESGFEVEAYDLVDRGYGKVGDFFKVEFPQNKYDIITNPPYDGNLISIVKRCLSLCKNKVAILLPMLYLSGKERHSELYSKYPPSRIYVYCERVTIAKDGDFKKYADSGANMTTYAWYIWEKGYKGSTELRWIHNDKQEVEKQEIVPKVEEVTILDGVQFKPYNEYRVPVKDCIQFHSKALPENKVLSNHFDCIITFRGVEFYSLEQLFMGLTYSDSPNVLKRVMTANSGIAAKNICREHYREKRDWDFEEKRYRIIALCHLYKYLSVKEYRDRLRETYPHTLVECPNGKDYHFGMVQNLETNVFEGNNCSGRTTMLVRDLMKVQEDKAVQQEQERIGRELTKEEREAVYEQLYNRVRAKYDNDKQVIKDSKPLITFIEKESIPKVKARRPKPFVAPHIDKNKKCLVLDFDYTVFDTSADNKYRKCDGKKDMDKAFEMIPQYKLYDGWKDVFEWANNNRISIAVLSGASAKLIEAAFKHFNLPCEAIIGYQPYIEKPNTILGNMLMERLHIREEQIIYVGDSKDDDVQARCSKLRFIGSIWGEESDKDYFKGQGIQTVSNPKELIPIMKDAGWDNGSDSILLGTIAGDMIGKPYERRDRAIKTTDFPLFDKRSKYTDDTVLTIAVMDWLLSDKEHKWDTLAERFVHFGTRYRIKGQDRCFSEDTAKWLLDDNRPFGKESKGNGAAMRVSPVGWFLDTVEEVEEIAKIQASLTHNTEEAIQGAQVAAVSVLLARQGKTKDEIRAFIEKRYGWNLQNEFNEYRNEYEWTSLCKKTVEGALMAFLASSDFEQAIRNAVSLGGDADTIGAITGSIAEAYYGEVPETIKKDVLHRSIPDEFKDVLKRFSAAIGR